MMSLADFQPERETVEFKGGSLSVRGLSLDDVTTLLRHHLDDLDAILEMYARDVDPNFASAATAQYAIKLVREAPGLVANIIALANDQPDYADNARRLPLPVQIELLKAIGRLTFEEVGGAKKFFESLATLMGSMQVPMDEATTDSPT